ncbi:MOSC domain-containing protein [Crenobacter luteus]|uniref:Molybdenum cofactor biosysynthesis protein n=1 Tax=Crenobacter luteus TaxID=1452487 RepID=A0A165FJF2_9NEIS|nr:MOSC domain-containing protein [Crenobacter luteus]KZE33465.1 molybdenum cofactor biosysynthesis protein [Crenobacter luteus]
MQLTELYVHPMKSSRGNALEAAAVTPRGLAHDREWLLVEPDGRFITGRTAPGLVRVEVEPTVDGARFSTPGRAPLVVEHAAFTAPHDATVWKDRFPAWHGDATADAWFSAFLGQPCRLLWLGRESQRAQKDDAAELSFADGYPYLLINRASLAELNAQLAEPVGARHFRANLVVDADFAWQEDEWQRIRVGEVEFEITKPCTRCVFTTVDPERGERRADGEPMKTLIRTRALPEGICFGVNMRALNSGTIRIGDALEVLESKFEF